MGGLQKRDRFWFASCLWTCWCSLPRFNIRQLVPEWCSRMKTSRQGNRQLADKVRRKNEVQNEIKTRSDPTPTRHPASHCLMVEKFQNLRYEIKTRQGDSLHLLYWAHRINKSRRSYGNNFNSIPIQDHDEPFWRGDCFSNSSCSGFTLIVRWCHVYIFSILVT